jgi:hypothetical protein
MSETPTASAALVMMDAMQVLPLFGCLSQAPLSGKFKRIGGVGMLISDQIVP